jgi:hypothetical protein
VRVQLYRCDWCEVEAPAVNERAPADWGILPGMPDVVDRGVVVLPHASELCAGCLETARRRMALAIEAARDERKAKRAR